MQKLPLSPEQEYDDLFIRRHLGPNQSERMEMLKALGLNDLEELTRKVVPEPILRNDRINLPLPLSEQELLSELREILSKNVLFKNYIGMGYYPSFLPTVILRNILENPGWYTAYTPYQAEISQGRMEALLNYQTMICDMTGMQISNASLLDEGTSAAEAVTMLHSLREVETSNTVFLSKRLHPQTIDVVETRCNPLGIKVIVGEEESAPLSQEIFAVVIQYPDTEGNIQDYESFVKSCHNEKIKVIVASDLMALALLKPPGEWGADVVVGTNQRFGLPLGFGGPHAGFFATKDEYKRSMPGRLIGVSKDSQGKPAMRLSLQTREQHIRRDKATSNICTAQVLLAVLSSMYAVYHGPVGIKNIASRIHAYTNFLKENLEKLGFKILHKHFFDTLVVQAPTQELKRVIDSAEKAKINLRIINDTSGNTTSLGISLDETVVPKDLEALIEVFSGKELKINPSELQKHSKISIPESLERKTEYLTHPVFNSYHTEHKMLRYIKKLESKDLSLTTSMIPLGSCTMKLNATTEMIPVTWPEVSNLHPFAPESHSKGYQEIFTSLEDWIAKITEFDAVSLQPNAGSQGEYAGLLAIRGYHLSQGNTNRNICLIPLSAHGTNPASAVMAGFKVVVVNCDSEGNIDFDDLKKKANEYKDTLGALMVTYPSTHGVFEEQIQEICQLIHSLGGQVYMDGANMNAQVGLTSPKRIGADVCHLNLHKTFCIPHGGGGPGIGPIAVAKHLAPHLPGHSLISNGTNNRKGSTTSAPWGSASITLISWAYIRMLGGEGLRLATQVAILNANYIAKKLSDSYPILYKGKNGFVAHECILDVRPFKKNSGVEAEDIAKRLMDYGFHAPTMSFPVPGTLMVEPTESEDKGELDRFIHAMITIFKEIEKIEKGQFSKDSNPLKNAPHTAEMVLKPDWNESYSREEAVYPAPWLKDLKFWPSVGRVDNVYGDRNLICSCLPLDAYSEAVVSK
jgi:glycine dehydrogenase